MNIPWEKIFALILEMIQDCEPDESKRLSALRRPRGLQALRFERRVRESMDLSPREWRKQGEEVMATIYAERDAATDDDLTELIDRAAAGPVVAPA